MFDLYLRFVRTANRTSYVSCVFPAADDVEVWYEVPGAVDDVLAGRDGRVVEVHRVRVLEAGQGTGLCKPSVWTSRGSNSGISGQIPKSFLSLNGLGWAFVWAYSVQWYMHSYLGNYPHQFHTYLQIFNFHNIHCRMPEANTALAHSDMSITLTIFLEQSIP